MVSCDLSNESYWAVRSCGTVCYAVQGGFNFWVWMKSYGVTIQMKATDYYFPVVLFVVMYKMVLPYLELYLKSYFVWPFKWTLFISISISFYFFIKMYL